MMRRNVVVGFAVAHVLCPATYGQTEAEEKRTLLEWKLPETPEIMYYIATPVSVVMKATVLPSGRVRDSMIAKTFWSRTRGNWSAVEGGYNDCVKKWRFEPAEHATLITIEFRYIPFPRGTRDPSLGVLVKDETIFEIRYETIVPIRDHGTNPPFGGRMTSSCGA